jgi:hypothetical protein
MSQITRPHVAPWIISDEVAALAGVLTTLLAANVVYMYAFETLAPITITGAKWRMGATTTGTTDIGVYDSNGNLLGHTGATTNTASTNMSASLNGGNITLAPGQYFMALCPSNSTDTYLAIGSVAAATTPTRHRQATNTGTAGVLPGTTGGYADTPSKTPAMSLTISGGLT